MMDAPHARIYYDYEWIFKELNEKKSETFKYTKHGTKIFLIKDKNSFCYAMQLGER